MTKPFYVLNVVEGKPFAMYEAEDWEKAVIQAVKMASEQCPDVPENEIHDEIERDLNWASNQGDIWVYILQTDN
jgi:hypothetical protein